MDDNSGDDDTGEVRWSCYLQYVSVGKFYPSIHQACFEIYFSEWNVSSDILRAHSAFRSTPNYSVSFNYPQL